MKEIIEQITDVQVEFIFDSVSEEINLKYGDITPGQNYRLEQIKEDLNDLVLEWAQNNKE